MRTRPHSDRRRVFRPSPDAIVAAVAGSAALALIATIRQPHWTAIGIFAAFVALTEMLDTELPSGRRLSLSLAPALGFALIGSPATHAARFTAGEVVLAYVAGAGAGMALHAATHRSLRVRQTATNLVVVAAASLVYRSLYAAGPSWMRFGRFSTEASALGLAVVTIIMLLLPAATETIREAAARRAPGPRALGAALRTGTPLQLAIVSVGALVALAYPKLGPWSFPLFLAPLAATQYAFRQYSSIRTTYVQTVRALARVPEMAGYTEPGHSRRVAELSVRMAREIGCDDAAIREIEYAALLHDIGRVVLEDPKEAVSDTTHRLELALTGAGIVEKTGYFPDVSRMIREQYEPYRRRGEHANADVSLGAKIIKVASAYDELVRPRQLGRSPWDALERLHLGMAYEYDPQVIQALTRVLEERGEI